MSSHCEEGDQVRRAVHAADASVEGRICPFMSALGRRDTELDYITIGNNI
jgi:hypothetical protein